MNKQDNRMTKEEAAEEQYKLMHEELKVYLDEVLPQMQLFSTAKATIAGILIYLHSKKLVTDEVFNCVNEFSHLMADHHEGMQKEYEAQAEKERKLDKETKASTEPGIDFVNVSASVEEV